MLMCKCGGAYRDDDTTVAEYSREHRRVLYSTVRVRSGYATRKCDHCGKVREQKLRVAKEIQA